MEYKRLTKRNANGEVETVKRPKSSYIQEVYEEWDEINRELKLRLAELEDKIEAGTLIEIPGIRKLNIGGMDCVEAVYIQHNGTIGECVCLNEAEAEAKLKELREKEECR